MIFDTHKTALSWFIFVSFVGFGIGCSEKEISSNDASPGLVFRLALELKPDSKIWEVSNLFKAALESESPDGSVKAHEIRVNFYDQGMVGTERQILEACYFGVIEVVQVNSSVVTTIDPAFGMLDLPYLFVNEAHHQAVLNGQIGRELLDRLRAKHLQGLGFYSNGFRNLFYKRAGETPCAETPEDLHGLKIRVMESPIMINSINAIGASATPIPFSELFQALKTGVVDGAENSAKIFMSYKYDEAGCNCFTLTEHFATQHALVANRSWLDNLEPKYKKRILEVAEEIVPAFDKIWNDAIAGALQAMQEKGITVNRISNKKAFVDRVESVSEQFFESYPVVPRTFYDRIRNIAMEFE